MSYRTLVWLLPLLLQLGFIPAANALETLPARELASHCALVKSEPGGVDGQYCVRYIQGFIDGAIATDARVLLNSESGEPEEETFLQRATRTRMPGQYDRIRAARLAGFCVGEPIPLRKIVDVVVTDLASLIDEDSLNEPAMETVYRSLINHFPCEK